MDKVFLTVLNMTFTASFVIAAIIIARLFLRKTPKIISYILWIAAGFRLAFPFSIESVLSLIPFKAQPIPQDIAEQALPRIETGIYAIDNAVSSILPTVSQTNSASYLQILITTGSIIWIAGVAVMLMHSIVSSVMLKLRLRGAVLIEDNIYEATIKTPFVMGFFKPKIYIPLNLPDNEKEYIILHEHIHIKRRDNIIKILAYFILSIHWFNPLVWAAFMLMSTDMEMSCDERVLKETGGKIKKAYSMSILSLAAERQTINIYPLAFGEGDTKRRIKNVLSYKKYSKLKIALTIILAAVLTTGLMLNNNISADDSQEKNNFDLAAEFLTKLNIISEDDIGEENITREEMIIALAKSMTGTPEYFQETAVAVQHLIENGIIRDLEWEATRDNPVTLDEAVKMLAQALGYAFVDMDILPNEVSITRNEWPGHMERAVEKEVRLIGEHAVFTFEDIPEDTILTKNDAVMLLYNFMMSDYNKMGAIWNGVTEAYEMYFDRSPVYAKFGIYIATPITSSVTVNGKKTEFDAYTIENTNYFKLRDLAYVLNGTAKQFDVETKRVESVIKSDEYGDTPTFYTTNHIKIGKPYTAVSGEMAEKGTNSITAFRGKGEAYQIDNATAVENWSPAIYEIDGEEYLKLRDVAEKLNFSVTWDSEKNTIAIDTSKPYNAE